MRQPTHTDPRVIATPITMRARRFFRHPGLSLAAALAIGTILIFCNTTIAQRQMEMLGRGLVALKETDAKAFVSWRLLGTDPDDITFNLYRVTNDAAPVKLNAEPIKDRTNFVDDEVPAGKTNAWFVRPVTKGIEQGDSARFALGANAPARPYLSIPLQTPDGYAPNDASLGDLDGDGEYEIVLHQTGRSRDNSQAGVTDPPILEAYKMDGTRLWRINLGVNIREGAHYTQFIVYDFDGDGRAEMACKTADGTTDGLGKVIGNAQADYRNERGYVLDGPEFLTIFDGRTGGHSRRRITCRHAVACTIGATITAIAAIAFWLVLPISTATGQVWSCVAAITHAQCSLHGTGGMAN